MTRLCRERVGAGVTLATLLATAPVRAQPVESLGVRALGMAGAFVALADDASAVYWNPAGLASGPYVTAVFEAQAMERVPGRALMSAERARSSLVAVGVPALGVSYYRVRWDTVAAADVPTQVDRNDQRPGRTGLRSLVTRHVGVTLLHSLGDAVAVGATLKYVHGTVAAASTATALEATSAGMLLQATADLPGRGSGAFDLDLGLLAAFGKIRVGLLGRNLREPSFETAGHEVLQLERQLRAGFAVRPNEALVMAVDADLTANRDASGVARRRLAFGAEAHVGRRVAVRGGARVFTHSPTMPVPALGISVALSRMLWIDSQATLGDRQNDRGWGLSGRLTY